MSQSTATAVAREIKAEGAEEKNSKDEAPNETESTPKDEVTLEDMKQVASKLVHFTGKMVNSNIQRVGIRLSSDDRRDLPYVSVKTVGPSYVQTDWCEQKKLNETNSLIRSEDFITKGIEHKDLKKIKLPLKALSDIYQASRHERYEIGTDHLSHYFRQIFIPKGDSYVCVTPVSSPGLAKMLSNMVTETNYSKNEDEGAKRRINTAAVPLGGRNPYNVAALLSYYRNLVVFTDGPRRRPEEIRALSMHYRGVRFIPKRTVIDNFIETSWWGNAENITDNATTTMKDRLAFEKFIKGLATAYVKLHKWAQNELKAYISILPNEALTDPSLSQGKAALIDPLRRTEGWLDAVTETFIEELRKVRYVQDDRERQLMFDVSDWKKAYKITKDTIQNEVLIFA